MVNADVFQKIVMKISLKHIKKIVTSKYLVTGIAFGIWMLFFDRNDLPLQIQRIHELNKLQTSEEVMTQKIKDTHKELEGLKNSPQTLEKYAREKYLMKRDNEDLFIVETHHND